MKKNKIDLKELIKKRDFIFAAVAIICSFFIFNKIKEASNKQMVSLESRIEEETQKNKLFYQIKNLDQKLDDFTAFKKLSQADKTLLTGKITSLAKENNLRIDSISFDNEDIRQFYTFLPIRLTLIGGFHNFGKFVSAIESLDQFLKVTEVKAIKIEGESSSKAVEKFELIVNAVIVKD